MVREGFLQEVTPELQELAMGTSGDRAFQVGEQCREREVTGDGDVLQGELLSLLKGCVGSMTLRFWPEPLGGRWWHLLRTGIIEHIAEPCGYE